MPVETPTLALKDIDLVPFGVEDIDVVLRRIFSDLLDVPGNQLTYASSPDTLEGWDSMVQINLIAALEEEFQAVIPPEQQLDILTFELIGDVIEELT
jgi:acyl carrier protein